MDEVKPFVSIARGLVYAAALLLYGVRGGPDVAARVALLAPVVLVTLVALEAVQRWRQTAQRRAAWAALTDFALTTALTLCLDPALSLLFGLVIVADGVSAGWRIALLLGLGAGSVEALVALTMPSGQGWPGDASARVLLWLGLAGITAALAWQRERERRTRAEGVALRRAAF